MGCIAESLSDYSPDEAYELLMNDSSDPRGKGEKLKEGDIALYLLSAFRVVELERSRNLQSLMEKIKQLTASNEKLLKRVNCLDNEVRELRDFKEEIKKSGLTKMKTDIKNQSYGFKKINEQRGISARDRKSPCLDEEDTTLTKGSDANNTDPYISKIIKGHFQEIRKMPTYEKYLNRNNPATKRFLEKTLIQKFELSTGQAKDLIYG